METSLNVSIATFTGKWRLGLVASGLRMEAMATTAFPPWKLLWWRDCLRGSGGRSEGEGGLASGRNGCWWKGK